jgi:hypothetical protein
MLSDAEKTFFDIGKHADMAAKRLFNGRPEFLFKLSENRIVFGLKSEK